MRNTSVDLYCAICRFLLLANEIFQLPSYKKFLAFSRLMFLFIRYQIYCIIVSVFIAGCLMYLFYLVYVCWNLVLSQCYFT